jgi:predicted Zn-dependent peptidase
MVKFQRIILENGLKVLLNQDNQSPMIAFNLLYHVGSKDETSDKTGLAHFFEHLMFSGTYDVPDYDFHVQMAGGENNAFTNADITNFYITLPAENFEIACWLESDRMQHLNLSQKAFDVQKKVVIEEFKETTLNRPYGDVWHHISDLTFTKHPYRWPTIGLDITHIEKFVRDDALDFYHRFYHPGNAILTVSGKFEFEEAIYMIEKWFGKIRSENGGRKKIEAEPKQGSFNQRVIEAAVPSNAIYLAFKMPGRNHPDYHTYDLISDILGRGRSSRLYQNLVKNQEVFSYASAYITGNYDPGLMIIEGNPRDHVELDEAFNILRSEIIRLKTERISEKELAKLKNKVESSLLFAETSILNKAINLAQYELLGDAGLINYQVEQYQAVTVEDIFRVANEVFVEENCSKLLYKQLEESS